jgi:hypothetical protein
MRTDLPFGHVLILLSLAAIPAPQPQEEPRIEDLVRAAGAYVAGYEQRLSMVGQEDYTQQFANARRVLQSDILFMQDETYGWVEFRDVAARDGARVRDREARLLALFSKPHPDRVKQAQRIVAEGARFNIDPPGIHVNRTINLPLTALRFLRPTDQHRSSFRLAGVVTGRANYSGYRQFRVDTQTEIGKN